MSTVELHAQPVAPSSRSDSKPIPTSFARAPRLKFEYSGSLDGVDTNLLILLHGRGDNEKPFAKLASSLKLPQTAYLALQGPLVVPLLDDHEREWWNETDMMGMNVANPDPTDAIRLLLDIITELEQEPYHWTADNIHLFGFGQGGSLACETAVKRKKIQNRSPDLASIVTVQGSLLSLPTPLRPDEKSMTKVLYVSRGKAVSAKSRSDIAALERIFRRVEHLQLPEKPRASIAMPDSKQEWDGIMSFWSEHLRSSLAWQRQGEVYEVTGGQASVKLPPSTSTNATQATGGKYESVPSSSLNATVSSGSAKVQAPAGMKRGFLSRGL